jgi:hypothetical protein
VLPFEYEAMNLELPDFEVIQGRQTIAASPLKTSELPIRWEKSVKNLPISVFIRPASGFSDKEPGSVEILIINRGNVAITVEFGPVIPYPPIWGNAESGELLYLIPNSNDSNYMDLDEIIPDTPIEGIWKLRDSFTRPDVAQDREIRPSEYISNEYAILFPAKTMSYSECYNSSYRFSLSLKIVNKNTDEEYVISDPAIEILPP